MPNTARYSGGQLMCGSPEGLFRQRDLSYSEEAKRLMSEESRKRLEEANLRFEQMCKDGLVFVAPVNTKIELSKLMGRMS